VVANLNTEASSTNKYVFLLPETALKQPSPRACMGHVVKDKVDEIIGSKLTDDNILVTDA
jgi:hypothetical protein